MIFTTMSNTDNFIKKLTTELIEEIINENGEYIKKELNRILIKLLQDKFNETK